MNPSNAYGGGYDPSAYSNEAYYGGAGADGSDPYNPYAGLQQQQGYNSIGAEANMAEGFFSMVNGVYVPNNMGSTFDGSTAFESQQSWPDEADPSSLVDPGTYFPVAEWQSPMIYGAPISAIAYDKTYDAIYLATDTLSSSSVSSRRGGLPQRDAMIVTHQQADGMLYAGVAGHPEAPPKMLLSIYSTLYGATQTTAPTRTTIPNHAFTPPYGRSDPALAEVVSYNSTAALRPNYQMGITTLLPLVEGGSLASVSPAGVRIHTVGGVQLADLHLEGMLTASVHPQSPNTHLTVGGIATSDQQLHSLDLWQGLRIVSSHALDRNVKDVAVTALATSQSRGCCAVGGSDGFLRLMDHRCRPLAKIKSHAGGVVNVAVSEDGTLVATTGYGSSIAARHPTTPPYGFPDPIVLINDIRYLGRGGFPHSFQGLRGGPRHVTFLPETEGLPSNRLLVASGQVGGGCQVLAPFSDANSIPPAFIVPQLNRDEAIHCLCVSDEKLAFGTNQGKVLQYQMAGYQKAKHAESISTAGGLFVPPSSLMSPEAAAFSPESGPETAAVEKIPLVMPSFDAPLPALSLDASILLNDRQRGGLDDRVRSVFGSYIMTAEPVVSALGDPRNPSLSSFGPLVANPLVGQCRMEVSTSLLNHANLSAADPVQTIVVSDLNVNILDDHRPRHGSRNNKSLNQPLANPNKFIYDKKMYDLVYSESLNRSKRYERGGRHYGKKLNHGDSDSDAMNIPRHYRLMLRPMHKSAASFNHSEFNQTALIPGFDYPFTMPNSFVPPVLLLLFFTPELRDAANKAQLASALSSNKDQLLLTELGYLFHRIEALSRYAYIFPANEGTSMPLTRVEAWAPLSFISCLMTMTEAERNQILDGSPAAVDPPRRPEAFYRFLLYQLDAETSRGRSGGLLDGLAGIDFCSINEFISGSAPPSRTTTRHLTVELSYDSFFGTDDIVANEAKKPSFGDVLQFNLCRASRLRAWSAGSKSYETIVQRKIATSLPTILSLSAACSGRKGEKGITLWQTNKGWLPEVIEVEIDENGSVIVRELLHDVEVGQDTWKECRGNGSIPSSVAQLLKEVTTSVDVRKRRYRLDAVLSMVRDDMDRSCPEEIRSLESDGGLFGHQVLHVRVKRDLKYLLVKQQRDAVQKYIASLKSSMSDKMDLTLAGRDADRTLFQKRLEDAERRLASLVTGDSSEDSQNSSWIAVNGFVVSDADVDDARAFDNPFKEPLLITYRALDSSAQPKEIHPAEKSKSRSAASLGVEGTATSIPPDVMRTSSLTNGSKSPYLANQGASVLPSSGDLVAFDAEFVAVAEETSELTTTGSKVTIRETRHAVARISILDGRTNGGRIGFVIVDDHVLPNEPVVDYLTRFSGIVSQDLHPKQSRHHLIPSRAAYWKLRFLVERGCIFVGHGLAQDFWTANVPVPSNQIIDTLDIYHKPAQRYISLRFLVNFVLKHDVQQDVHDSVEDAMSALELYRKAIELKENGTFDKVLDDLYAYGQKNDWKLGIDEADVLE